MKNPITTETQKLFETGNNIEERRVGFIEALEECDELHRRRIAEGNKKSGGGTDNACEGIEKAKPDLSNAWNYLTQKQDNKDNLTTEGIP